MFEIHRSQAVYFSRHVGSHGRATAEGQTAMPAHYHVTEAFTDLPLKLCG
jgi:hypothetical protein